MSERTGLVRVTLKGDLVDLVPAASFGAAARQVRCGPGQIIRFEWERRRRATDRRTPQVRHPNYRERSNVGRRWYDLARVVPNPEGVTTA